MTLPAPHPLRLARLLAGADYFRRSPSRLGGRGEHKEWQHFLVHTRDAHLLVNFNLVDEPWAKDPRSAEAARLIVLARTDGWDGDLERFDGHEVEVTAGRVDARFGESSMRLVDGRYHLTVALRERAISAELVLVPLTAPTVLPNQALSRERCLSWLIVPRLAAHGTITLNGRTVRVESAPAYHDHNWGHFRWGDDFSWVWGSAVPWEASSPWSLVHVRMVDRGRSVVRSQGLFLWRGPEPLRMFRDEEIRSSSSGQFGVPRPLKVPRVMAIVEPGVAHDIPRRTELLARGDGDELHVVFEARDEAQLVMPSEVSSEGVTVIHEVLGHVSAQGNVRGERVELEGPGVFEFVRD